MQFIFTIQDAAAGAYLPPFTLPASGMALRSFSDCVNDSKHAFGHHPADYTLFQIGTWDELTGEIVYTGNHKKLANGLEAKTQNDMPLQENLKAVK